MEIQNSKVYVLLDERNRVLRCEGGYTATLRASNDIAGVAFGFCV